MQHFGISRYAATAAAFLFYLAPASAAVSGTLSIANCSGGGVAVSATTIDFTLPVGGGTGCIATATNTNVAYSTGTLLPAVAGTIKDLTSGGPSIVLDFMTFSGNPDLHFDLTQLGPGVNNTDCVNLALGDSCSAVAGSPFILQKTATGTTISL